MKNKFDFIFICIFFLIISFPSIQMRWKIFNEQSIKGSEEKQAKEEFKISTLLNGSFQNYLTEHVSNNIGFRAELIKTDNQINLSLFNQISSSYESKIILGKNNYLYEKLYLKAYNRLTPSTQAGLRWSAESLIQLEGHLKKLGKALLVVIAPSKAEIYPEYIPKKHVLKNKKRQASKKERLLNLLKGSKVEIIDTEKLFIEHAKKNSAPLFAKSSAHWNAYGACIVGQKILKKAAVLLERKIRSFTCEPLTWLNEPLVAERDLSDLTNIWFPERFYEKTLYPKDKTINRYDASLPNVLIVGDSYSWALLNYFDRHKVYKKRDMFYYNSRNFKYPSKKTTKINSLESKWVDNLLEKDIIIIEIVSSRIEDIGFGFLQQANRRLSKVLKR